MCCFSQGCFFSLDWPFTRYYCWYNVAFKAAELVHVLLQSKSCEYKQRVRAHVDSAHFPLQQTVCCVDSTQSQTTLSALNFFNLPATLPCNICLPDVGVLSSHCWKLCTVIYVGVWIHEYLSKNSLLRFKDIIKSHLNPYNYFLPYSVLPTGY